VRLAAERDRRVQGRANHQVHIAAPAAIAAARTAARHVFFAAEVDNAIAAIAALDVNLRLIKGCHTVEV
jgi:hypothetical protein